MSQHSIIEFFSLESGLATEFRRLLHNVLTLGKDRELKALSGDFVYAVRREIDRRIGVLTDRSQKGIENPVDRR